MFGGASTCFGDSEHVPVANPAPSAPRGDSNTDTGIAGDLLVPLPDDVAEYSPDLLAEFSSDMQFLYDDAEVYGVHMPARHINTCPGSVYL